MPTLKELCNENVMNPEETVSPINSVLVGLEYLKISVNSGLSDPVMLKTSVEKVLESIPKTAVTSLAFKNRAYFICGTFSSSKIDSIFEYAGTNPFTQSWKNMVSNFRQSQTEDKIFFQQMVASYKSFFSLAFDSWINLLELDNGSNLQYDTAIFSILKFLLPDEWFQMQTDLRTVQKYRKRFVNLK